MEQFSQKQRNLFYEAFLHELLKNSVKKIEIYRLEKLIEVKYGIPVAEDKKEIIKAIVEKREKDRKEKFEKRDLKSMIDDLSGYSPSVYSGFSDSRKKVLRKKPVFFEQSKRKKFKHRGKIFQSGELNNRILRVPEPRLPSRLNYLKPSLNSSEQIDLGKLLDLAKDPNVKNIEIEGPGKNVFVIGLMGKKKTGIVLNKEEVNKIIDNFSVGAKIPLSDGVNKIAYGGFVLNAIVSEGMDKRFSLKKIEEVAGSGVRVAGGQMKRRVY